MSVNKVILVGRLGRDPETRFTGGGQAVANFSLATDETYKDKNGEKQKRTEWRKITVWGKQAEIAQQYLKKGSLVYVEGRIQTREWQDKEGQKRTSYDIVCNNFRMLGGRADGAAAGASAGASSHSGGFGGGGRQADPIWKADRRAMTPKATVRKFPTKIFRSKNISLPAILDANGAEGILRVRGNRYFFAREILYGDLAMSSRASSLLIFTSSNE